MIVGKSVVLRLIRPDELTQVHQLWQNLDLRGEYTTMRLQSLVEYEKQYKEQQGFWSDQHGVMLIEDREGRLLGSIGFFKPMAYLEGYEIGASIYFPEDRSHGYMTEAAQLFCSYLFGIKPTPRLMAASVVGNAASRRVIEKIGFTHEGTFRRCIFHRGEYVDADFFSLLREECPSLENVLRTMRS